MVSFGFTCKENVVCDRRSIIVKSKPPDHTGTVILVETEGEKGMPQQVYRWLCVGACVHACVCLHVCVYVCVFVYEDLHPPTLLLLSRPLPFHSTGGEVCSG